MRFCGRGRCCCRPVRRTPHPAAAALVYGGLATLALAAIAMMTTQLPRRLAGLRHRRLVGHGACRARLRRRADGRRRAVLHAGFHAGGERAVPAGRAYRARARGRRRGGDRTTTRRITCRSMSTSSRSTGPTDEDDKEAQAGQAIPASMAFLGLSFTACALVIAGLPPLSGFLAQVRDAHHASRRLRADAAQRVVDVRPGLDAARVAHRLELAVDDCTVARGDPLFLDAAGSPGAATCARSSARQSPRCC